MIKKIIITSALIIISGCIAKADEKENKVIGGDVMKLSSPEFENGQFIPKKFTCQGQDVNPALTIDDIPENVKSLALIVDDPDAPMRTWLHWIVYNIPVISRIEENSVPGDELVNDFARKSYGGPCPPAGIHRYFFRIYALDTKLILREGALRKNLEKAMEGHIISEAELMGLYKTSATP